MMDVDRQFTGKYESEGHAGALLVRNFYVAVHALLEPVLGSTGSVFEIGCGAGYSTQRLSCWVPETAALVSSDLGGSLVRKAADMNPAVPVVQQSVYELALADKSVDLLVMLEVLEHLEDPQRALSELRRVARRHVLLSTPREPIWRALNFCRAKYVTAFGNTPGHIQHWSSRALQREVESHFDIVGMRQPLPWTILLLSPRP